MMAALVCQRKARHLQVKSRLGEDCRKVSNGLLQIWRTSRHSFQKDFP